MFPKVQFPAKQYDQFSDSDCNFVLSIPSYSRVDKKEFIFEDAPAHPCWFDLVFDTLNATIHWSYYPIEDQFSLDGLINDAYTMASKHNVRADFREEFQVSNEFGTSGIIFKIEGPVATPYQFYMTDSTDHFLRGSLYFDEKMKRDSMQIVIDFLAKDIDKMLSTLNFGAG